MTTLTRSELADLREDLLTVSSYLQFQLDHADEFACEACRAPHVQVVSALLDEAEDDLEHIERQLSARPVLDAAPPIPKAKPVSAGTSYFPTTPSPFRPMGR